MSNKKEKINQNRPVSVHWADINADKIIREKGEKERYTCASGVTPSGTVHIGNFREIISVELVARALRDKGKHVRFIFSWDEYDVFRKVPKNMPDQKLLATYLRKPITLVPDTTGEHESYARKNEKAVEEILPVVGVNPEFIYQAKHYRDSDYAQGIRTALEHTDELRKILDEHRTAPLPEDWWPISVFSNFTDKDTTTILGWDGEWGVTYRCEETGKEEAVDLRNTAAVKLLWRIDWPMRWAKEDVDFEPAGKDHHSEGGSFDTAKTTVSIFGGTPPVTFQYDFVRIKGKGGKISSSSGEVVSLNDVLEIYPPEIVRYLFVGTRPNSEFAISFDLDVLKIFEDYDKCERVYYGVQQINEKKRVKESRIYELSQVNAIPEDISYQASLRHLCNQLQVHNGNIDSVIAELPDVKKSQIPRLRVRCRCAWNWVRLYAPEDFCFSLQTESDEIQHLPAPMLACVKDLAAEIRNLENLNEKAMAEVIYRIAHDNGVEPAQFFTAAYKVLIGKEKGPRLAGFILTCGKEKILSILGRYVNIKAS
ncbi:MAG: lysine--tRNA ligase [Spirochaetales bacterium]|nr:lysine--tRNA ligase [Spirochaetales bacterium]